MKRLTKVILYHSAGIMGEAFDIFVSKSLVKKYKKKIDWLYSVPCDIAAKFLKKHPHLVWLGSEDLCHIAEINGFIREALCELVNNEGFIEIYYQEKQQKRKRRKK